MVEINNKADAQFVFYPKTQNDHQGPYTLHIHSELSQKDWYFEDVEDKASLHDYYKFLLDYKSVDDGEFNYYIIENDEVMDTGLMRIGIGKAKVKGYDTPNEIIQYDMYAEPTERYEDKDVTITENGEYTITPDEGYNAIAQVNLTVDVSCDDAWQSGYTSGYTDGYNAGYDSGYTAGYMAGYEAGSEACGRDYLTVRNTSSQPTTVDITPSSVLEGTFEYRKTGGVWESITGYTRVTIENGEKVEFRGDNPQYSEDYANNTNIRVFGGSAEVYGNVMSLIADAAEFPSGSDYNFCGLFQNSYSLTDASNLLLPVMMTQGCYQNMFKGCNTLTGTPELNATEIVQSCYEGMFEGCSSLTTAPDMPGLNNAKYCYKRMFANCSSLRNNIPASLPGGLAPYGCYYEMFENCTSLTTVPILPATELHGSAYFEMFRGCTSLTTAPALPATTLTYGEDDMGEETTGSTHYFGMFMDCTSMTTAPSILPVTHEIPDSSYAHMFQGCTSLTTAPVLPAAELGPAAYSEMFRGCSSLNYVKCLSQNTGNSRDWLLNVAETGTFVKDAETTWGRGPSAIPVGWWVVDDGPADDYSKEYLTIEPLESGTLKVNRFEDNKFIYYSINNGTWENASTSQTTTSISVSNGDKVRFKSDRRTLTGCRSLFSGNTLGFKAYGNVSSISYLDDFSGNTNPISCYEMFRDCSGLTDASNLILPGTVLETTTYPANGWYAYMFRDCVSLTTAPELPATSLAERSYYGMFNGCTSLNYIKCLATDISARSCTTEWVINVPQTGTFVKNPNMTGWTSGDNGIPNNWTVVDAE